MAFNSQWQHLMSHYRKKWHGCSSSPPVEMQLKRWIYLGPENQIQKKKKKQKQSVNENSSKHKNDRIQMWQSQVFMRNINYYCILRPQHICRSVLKPVKERSSTPSRQIQKHPTAKLHQEDLKSNINKYIYYWKTRGVTILRQCSGMFLVFSLTEFWTFKRKSKITLS